MPNVSLTERGPHCVALTIDAQPAYDRCFEADHLPVLVYAENVPSGVFLLAVDAVSAVKPSDGVRVLRTSDHFVVGQMVSGNPMKSLEFDVEAPSSVQACRVTFGLLNCSPKG